MCQNIFRKIYMIPSINLKFSRNQVNQLFIMLCNVHQKISCVLETVVVEESSTKRANQSYKVLAGETLKESAEKSGVLTASPTEKVDGTCVYVTEFNGKPWLWARLDRKPNKAADKRFKKYKHSKRLGDLAKARANKSPDGVGTEENDAGCGDIEKVKSAEFVWNVEKDFKDVPQNWIPASGVPITDGIPQPDDNGHIPGWVPVELKSRQYCWHLTSVNLDRGIGLLLRSRKCDENIGDEDKVSLEVVTCELSELSGATLELIGTNINGNPYKLGSKQNPVHLLVRHGSIPVGTLPSLDRLELSKWFQESTAGQLEGIVWHCADGEMFKLHRHHLELGWPVSTPRLTTLPVHINIGHDIVPDESKSLFQLLSNHNSRTFPSLSDIPFTT